MIRAQTNKGSIEICRIQTLPIITYRITLDDHRNYPNTETTSHEIYHDELADLYSNIGTLLNNEE